MNGALQPIEHSAGLAGAWTRWSALSGACAPPFFTVAVIVATLVTPGYSHVSRAISELAAEGTPHPGVLPAGIVGYGVLVMPLSLVLWRRLPRSRATAVAAALMIVYGLGGIFAGLFPVVPDDAPPTAMEWLHGAAARTAFAAITVQTFLVPWILRGDRRWRGFSVFSLAMGVLTVLFAVPFEAHWWEPAHGVFQRGFFATTMAWVEVVSFRMIVLGAPSSSSARLT